MTKKQWMLMGWMVCAGVAAPAFAADPPVIPADVPSATPSKAEAKKKVASAKKSSEKKSAAEKKSSGVIALPHPEPAVVSQKNVNVRGQALLNSEVVARLKKGDSITVLEEITTTKRKDEPNKWYKISLPPSASVWVNSSIGLDADKKVKSSRLNLRSGPGENFSVIGRVEKGTPVTVIETKGEWSKIEPPADSFAFVAAHLITRQPAGAAVVAAHTPPPTPPPVMVVNANPPSAPVQPPVDRPVPVAAPPIVVAPPPTFTPLPVVTPPPVVTAPPVGVPLPVVTTPPVSTPPPVVPAPPGLVPVVRPTPMPPPEEPLVKRVVTREGIVKSSVSVQAPTHFVLRGLDNNKTVNYLFSPSTNILIKDYKGQRVIVTGEESLDERWPNTPVIEIETIQPVTTQ